MCVHNVDVKPTLVLRASPSYPKREKGSGEVPIVAVLSHMTTVHALNTVVVNWRTSQGIGTQKLMKQLLAVAVSAT